MDDGPTLYIVCGCGEEAERFDRPIAYHLARAIGPGARVCADLWYLNQQQARAAGVIAIGRPQANALSAFLGDKLPSLFAVDDRYLVQADPAWHEPVACCWGVSPEETLAAVEAFIARGLPDFLRVAAEGS